MSKSFWAILEGMFAFVIWSFLGYWLAQTCLEITDPSVRLPREIRIAIRCSSATLLGAVAAVLYVRRALDVYRGVRKPGQALFTGKGGKPEVTGASVIAFVFFALVWAWWIFCIQSQGRH